jgi:hypothetical protein
MTPKWCTTFLSLILVFAYLNSRSEIHCPTSAIAAAATISTTTASVTVITNSFDLALRTKPTTTIRHAQRSLGFGMSVITKNVSIYYLCILVGNN